MKDNPIRRSSRARAVMDEYHSVEFSITGCAYVYMFKIWDISSKGSCVLVKEESDLLNHLKVGDILNLKYYTTDPSKPIEQRNTEIKHISKDEGGRFKGLYLVGLSVLERQRSRA